MRKGTRLLEMTKQGFHVPTGFIVTSSMCLLFYDNQEELLQFLMGEIQAAIRKIRKNIRKNICRVEKSVISIC